MIILCVEDQVPTLHVLGELCKAVHPEAEVLLCSNDLEGCQILERQELDMVITDLDFRGDKSMALIEAAAKFRIPCLVYSAHDGPAFVRAAFDAGATAFVSKFAPLAVLQSAVSAGRELTARHGSLGLPGVAEEGAPPLVELSWQKERILVGIIHGESRQEIGQKLRLSTSTVNTYLRDLCVANECKKEELIHRYLTWNRLK